VLRPILDRHRLNLISAGGNHLREQSVEAELEAIEPHRALLTAMGCRVLVYAETSGGIAGDRRRPRPGRDCRIVTGAISRAAVRLADR
jgi:inosose dehydratase